MTGDVSVVDEAGLRAKEMASLTWAMVTDAQGQVRCCTCPTAPVKETGGRTIPLHPDLEAALVALQTGRGTWATPERPILFSERGGGRHRRPCACGSIASIAR